MPEPAVALPIVRSPGLDRGFALSGRSPLSLYLRPVGLLRGDAARAAQESGLALALAGGRAAFGLCEILIRHADRIEAALRPVAAVRDLAQRDDELGKHVADLLERLSAPRPPFAGLSFDRPRLMGVVNVTPDSFSDGGDHATAASAVAHGKVLIAAGADLLDIGGESTRPGADPVSAAEELHRVLPVIAGLKDEGAPLSIDTRHAAVMAASLDGGAGIVNDVTALAGDPKSLALVAARGCPVVLMHMQGEPKTMQAAPRYSHVALDVFDMLATRIAACVAAGIPRARIAIDPGIGFGKTFAHNHTMLEYLALLHGLGCALLVGASRKRFTAGSRTDIPPKQRLGGSLAAALAALSQGAQLLRVHDLAETRQAIEIWRGAAGEG